MTSSTYFYRKSIFARVVINLVIFLLVYLAIVRPLRMQVTAKVVYPVLITLFSGSAEVFLSPSGPGIGMHFQGIDQRIWVVTPFGVYWGIPFVLLASIRRWGLVKKLTNYHVAVTFILPILLSLFFMRWVWTIVPTNISDYLNKFLGLSFCVFFLKEFYDEYHSIRKTIGVNGGVK